MNASTSEGSKSSRPRGRLVHLELLVMLVVLMVVQSFLTSGTFIQRAIFYSLFFVVVLSAIRTLSQSGFRLYLALVLGVFAFVGSWFAEPLSSAVVLAAVDCCYVGFFLVLIVVLCDSVFGDGDVDMDRIIGAVCIFFLLGLVWALIYTLLEVFQPGSFRITAIQAPGIQQEILSEMMYFSYVTLTTLGYGDVVPVTSPSRTLAAIEAMVGQLYIAIVIARLVGLHLQTRGKST